jgi:hypothetical protein
LGKRRRGDPRVIDGNRLCSPRDSDVRPKPTNGNIEGEDGVGPQSRFELEQTPPTPLCTSRPLVEFRDRHERDAEDVALEQGTVVVRERMATHLVRDDVRVEQEHDQVDVGSRR